MESSQLDHAATGASPTDATNAAASHANNHANTASNGAQAPPNETDLWGALSPMSGSFTTMQPVINVSQAPLSASSAANPFDAFDAFAPSSAASSSSRSSSASTLVLPPPAPQSTANAVVSLGSPLISFSPVANIASSSASLSLDTTTTTTTSTTPSAFAVDDLLSFSFSPVAAPPASSLSSSSSLMMMDDFFLGSTSSTSSSTSAATNDTTGAFASSVETAMTTETTTTTTNSLLSFSPVANVAAQAPFSDSFGSSDLSDFPRGSFGGFEGGASIDHIAPHSAPAAFEEMDASLLMAREDFSTSIEVSSGLEDTEAYEEETHTVEIKAVVVSEDQYVNSASTHVVAEVAAVTEHSEQLHDAVTLGDEGLSPDSSAWSQHDIQEEVVATLASEQGPIAAEDAYAAKRNDYQAADYEDKLQGLDEFDQDQYVAHSTVEEVSFPQDAEPDQVIRESLSSTDVVATVAEEVVVETVAVETSVVDVQAEHVDHSAFEAISADDEQVSESGQSPVSSGTASEEQTWPSQLSPATEPVTGFEELSTSSGHDSRTSDGADDDEGFTAVDGDDYYAERKSDAMESQFESEATALYAEVDDNEEEYTADQHHDHPVLSVSVAQLQLPLPEVDGGVQSPENCVNSPSSVVSSPGSSVAGSAFAFISEAASSFAFTPSVPSPQAAPAERESFERESSGGGEDSFSPVATHHAVAREEEGVRGSVEEESEWPSTTEEKDVKEPAIAEIELDGEEGFSGFNDQVAYADVHGEEVSSSPAQEPALSYDFQSSVEVSNDIEDSDDGFGGFNDAVKRATSESSEAKATSAFGFESFAQSTSSVSASYEADSSFGFVSTANTAALDDNDDDDGFGGFGQSTTADGGDDDDDFGDFGTSDAWGSSTASGGANGDDDDDFGDFTPSSSSQQWGEATTTSSTTAASSASWGAVAYEPQPVAIAAPSDLNEFFGSAFPASKAPVATSLLPKPTPSHGSGMMTMTASAIFDQANGGAVHKSFHASLQEYRTMLTAEHDEHPHQQQPSFESEALRLKYLKYVLTEKLTEASRPDGVFPHGSEKYHLFASIAESGHEKNMRDALAQLQEGLFQGSVNEAVMRIAKQAALSAKARIAEQAAQQQAHARGSLLATTRHFLSRTAASSSSGGPGSADKEGRGSRTGSGSLGVLTPTTASVHKMSRFAFQNGQETEAAGNSSGYGSGEDTGSDVSVGEASGHSEGDVAGPPGGSGPPSGSSGRGGGGLMKKFQDRLTSFSSTKQRARTVSLRRMGQSSEDVVKMELHMESINGGFDEVKWRCAVFLYETEEVSHLAPSQIKILAYPSNQLLSGKSDKSALSKFFKPGTIWSIDIGANSNAGVSME